jgi:AcrR family transcriptional regulator
MTAPAPSPAARRGRPRSEAIDEAILAATVEEIIARGFLGLSVEAVAARAGVAKTTLYRRWPGTHELALAAMRRFETDVRNPPAGTVRDQLLWLLEAMRRKWNDPQYSAMMRRVTGDGVAQPETYKQARDRLIGPQLQAMHRVLQRGVDEGLIRPDLDLSWVRQMMTAPITAATLTLKERVSRAQVEATVDTVLRGAAP